MDPSLLPALFDALTVARSGSVTAAAERLHKTPSAVSQQLRRLADAVPAPLFERRGRTLALSPLGVQALPALTALFDEAEAAFDLLRELAGDGATLLRVAASDYIGRALLVPVLRELASGGAPLRYEITTVHSQEAVRSLLRADVDLAVVSGAFGREPGALVARELLQQPFFWVLPKRPRRRRLDERLAAEPVLRLAPGSVGRRLLDEELDRRGIAPLSTIDVPSVSLLLAYATAGLGIGLVPGLAVGTLDRRVVALERADVPAQPVRLLTRARWHAGAAAGRFVKALEAEAAGRGRKTRPTGGRQAAAAGRWADRPARPAAGKRVPPVVGPTDRRARRPASVCRRSWIESAGLPPGAAR